jgi:hypothetical protein
VCAQQQYRALKFPGEIEPSRADVINTSVCVKKAYSSVRREVLCNILAEFGISRKLVGLIKMCLNGT